jgi:hypothetical protein
VVRRHTFTESNTGLHSHILSGRTREKKSPFGVARILETPSIFERSEVGARRLGRFLISLHDRVTTSVDTGNESKRRSSGCEVVEVQHDEDSSSDCMNEKVRRRKRL